ncbi:MAG: SRPBCC family protein [Polyangiales bacterium]
MVFALATLAAVLAGVLIVASRRPDDFRVERSIAIAASPEAIASHLDDFHRWTRWSPWEGLDPAMKRTYSGAEKGVGAVYAWEGNGKVGAGRMEVLASSPSAVRIKLDFLRPFEAHNQAEFGLEPGASGTKVTWAMTGKSAFPAKVMGLFLDMDEMIGKDFAKGLANLKDVVEKG